MKTCYIVGLISLVVSGSAAGIYSNNPFLTRASRQKCAETASVPNGYLGLAANSQPVTLKPTSCDKNSVKLIVGGTKAGLKEFPHMAAVGYGEDQETPTWGCGGSLISDRYVLTAGHCLSPRHLGDAKFVRLGALNLSSKSARVQNFRVVRLLPHSEYDPPLYYHDIGLLKLDRPAILTPFVKPICLDDGGWETSGPMVACGWGATRFGGENSSHLLKVTLEAFPQDDCFASYGVTRRLTSGIRGESQICAGFRNESKDTCSGDSGGPLQVMTEDCKFVLVGLTSFGKLCGVPDIPGVYTRVSHYVDWIESVVWPN